MRGFQVLDTNGNRKTLLNAAVSSITDTSTGTVTGWTPALSGTVLIEWSGSSDATFDSLIAGYVGQRVTIKNTGSHVAYFAHQSASATKAKFSNIVTSGPTPIAAGGFLTYCYDGTYWQLVGHQQGVPINVPYNGTNFIASGSMTWTVTSGNVVVNSWTLDGSNLEWSVRLQSTSVGGTLSNELRITLPNGFTGVVSELINGFASGDNTSAFVIAQGGPVASQSYVRVFKDMGSGANWSTSVNNTFVDFRIRISIN